LQNRSHIKESKVWPWLIAEAQGTGNKNPPPN